VERVNGNTIVIMKTLKEIEEEILKFNKLHEEFEKLNI
jgi:hypothetical protein